MNYTARSRPQLIPQYIPPMSIVPRDYQLKADSDIDAAIAQGHRRILVAGSPGSGKTALMAMRARRAYNQRLKTTILVPFNCVVSRSATEHTQMVGSLDSMGLQGKYGVYSGAFPELINENAPIQIVTLQTLQSQADHLHSWLSDSDVILIDEGHSATFFKEVEKIYRSWNWKLIVNFTATPFNRGQGVDDRHGELERNTALVKLPTYRQLEQRGQLAPLTYHSLVCPVGDDEKLDLDSDEAIEWMLNQLPQDLRFGVGFCKPRNKGRSQMEAIKRIGAAKGIRFEIVGDGVSQQDYQLIMAEYESGQTNLLCVQALSTGWDSPITQHVLLFRPIPSRDRYGQILGRCDRPHPSKSSGHIWDFGGNVQLGDKGLHPKLEDLYDSISEWVLLAKSKGEGEAPVKPCISCKRKILTMMVKCPHCKADQPLKSLLMVDPSSGKIVSSISDSEAQKSRGGAIEYFRQWRKIGYLNQWKPYAAMVKCQDLGIKVDLTDSDFWEGSTFESPQNGQLKSGYRQYLCSKAKAWGWDAEKIQREIDREFE